MDILTISAEDWVKNEEEYLKFLTKEEIWNKIPMVNANALHNLKDGTLVKFQGMVQDMYGPEYYVPLYDIVNEITNERTTRNGKYCDVTKCDKGERIDFDNSTNIPSERHNYVVISVPGVNSWVHQYESSKHQVVERPSPSVHQNKRCYETAMEVDSCSNQISSSEAKKVSSEGRLSTQLNKGLVISPEHILNHPLADSNSKVCHIRIYKDSNSLKLNDVCEFVGFLSLNFMVDIDDEENFENQIEIQTHNPPTSLVPRIHVVHFKKMSHNNPLVHNLNENKSYFANIKKELQIVFSQILMGDSLAAEYMICHLISEVYLRKDYMALGQFCLNISNVPKLKDVDYIFEIYKFLELVLTKSHYLPLTLKNMNTLEFIPKKDYKCNRLSSGILQLSQNTLLVLDETKLTEGKLNPPGVHAVKSLTEAIKNQKVTYDFNYYSLEYECDIQFLVFSEGKSILPSDIHLPLNSDETCLKTFIEIIEAAKHFLKPNLLNQIRIYLTKARLLQYEISEDAQEFIQKDFVNMRQDSKVTAQDLHSLLVLCRLLCISEGKTNLDEECWQKACEMENQRKTRILK